MPSETSPNKGLWLYSFLCRKGWPKSYSGKVFFVAFLGTHIPLLALFGFAISSASIPTDRKVAVLVVALVATLVGTGLTLYALNQLMEPISLAFRALRGYLEENRRPQLPTDFTDEVGVLMADTTFVLGRLDDMIQRLSNYDEVTTLANRSLCTEVLGKLQREGKAFAVIVLQLEGLANVSSSLRAGERETILATTAQRLTKFQGEAEVLCRASDESFALVVTEFEDIEEAEARALGMITAVSQPLTLGSITVQLRGVAGIATAGDDEDPSGVLACAESAAAEARRIGPGEYAYFSAEMTARLRQRLAIESELARALPNNEFRLVFQPIVGIPDGQVASAEALVRWNLDGKPVSPAIFIPIAEESGLIVALGNFVLHAACRHAKSWQVEGNPIKVSVNVSPRQLRAQGFVFEVASALKETGLDASLLQLEVTEGALVEDVENAIAVLQELRELGVSIALDDFGTGYSSLSYLKRLPIDVLKIDQSFVRGLPEDGDDLAIVRSIMALADSLGMAVVAEGVETPAQMECLIEEGCTCLQGYLFGKPMPAADLISRLSHRPSLRSNLAA